MKLFVNIFQPTYCLIILETTPGLLTCSKTDHICFVVDLLPD